MSPEPEQRAPTVKRIGRYALHREIAAGGMATVHIGRLLGQVGFSRTVAIRRLHPQFAKDPEFVAMFLDEARLAARIQHPNVVSTLDVVSEEDELFLVMDFIQGESLSRAVKLVGARGERLPLPIAGAILVGTLNGLHAAHEARDERGAPLNVVHRVATIERESEAMPMANAVAIVVAKPPPPPPLPVRVSVPTLPIVPAKATMDNIVAEKPTLPVIAEPPPPPTTRRRRAWSRR